VKTKAQNTGTDAESRALDYHEKMGWSLIERNWRCKLGEIDLIFKEPDGTIVFVEVRYRSNSYYGLAQESVGSKKQIRIGRAALYYIKHKRFKDKSYRFDVTAVTPEEVTHIPNAFTPSGYTL